jgi:hypothetical protein
VDEEPPVEQETVKSWTNPHTAEYKRRQQMLMAMRSFEVIAMTRDLNLTSYAFSKNANELQTHIYGYPEIGQSQPFNPDVGDPFGVELARLLANFLASVGSLISVQRVVLRDIWPKIGGQLSEFEQDEYTTKRLAVFEADEAKLLVELRNYSQHKFLPYLNPSWAYSQAVPMAEFQFRLHVEPLLKWDKLPTDVRKYLEKHEDSIDLIPIIGRYTAAVREFYKWFWLKIDEKMKPRARRIRCPRSRIGTLRRRGVPSARLVQESRRGAAARLERSALAPTITSRNSTEAMGPWAPLLSWHRSR